LYDQKPGDIKKMLRIISIIDEKEKADMDKING